MRCPRRHATRTRMPSPRTPLPARSDIRPSRLAARLAVRPVGTPRATRLARLARLACGASLIGCAGVAAPPAHGAWRGGIDGGTTLGGDGGTATLLRLNLVEDSRPFSQRIFAEWVRRGGDGADAWRLGYVPRYHFSPTLYGFAEAGLRADGELGIDSEVRALAGVGTAFELEGIAALRAEAGVGAVRTDYGRVPGAGDGALDGALDDAAEVSGLAVLRGGASRTFAERVRLALDAEAEVREATSELRAEASAAVRAGAGSVALTVRTRRLDADGGEPLSVTDTFVGYSLGF